MRRKGRTDLRVRGRGTCAILVSPGSMGFTRRRALPPSLPPSVCLFSSFPGLLRASVRRVFASPRLVGKFPNETRASAQRRRVTSRELFLNRAKVALSPSLSLFFSSSLLPRHRTRRLAFPPCSKGVVAAHFDAVVLRRCCKNRKGSKTLEFPTLDVETPRARDFAVRSRGRVPRVIIRLSTYPTRRYPRVVSG